jgi:excisionase family DNA binding protein
MSVKQAAARLEVSVTTVYALVAAGRLRCYRVGMGRGCIRIAEEHLAEYLGKAEPKVAEPAAPPPPRVPRLKHLRIS